MRAAGVGGCGRLGVEVVVVEGVARVREEVEEMADGGSQG